MSRIDACRSCGSPDGAALIPVLDLGRTPLANRLLARDQLRRARADLPARPRLLPALHAAADHRDGPARGPVPRLPLLLVLLRHDAPPLPGELPSD